MRVLFHWILISENINGNIELFFSTPALVAGVVFLEQGYNDLFASESNGVKDEIIHSEDT